MGFGGECPAEKCISFQPGMRLFILYRQVINIMPVLPELISCSLLLMPASYLQRLKYAHPGVFSCIDIDHATAL
jgi:hypothetical protein